MSAIPKIILDQAQSLPEGSLLSPKEFLHHGNRTTINQAFSRLSREGKLLRIARGMYVAPITTRFGTHAPSSRRIIQALATQKGEIVVPHGASSANFLGLTQQVPINEVYLTSGKTRLLMLGQAKLVLKHAPH